MLFSIVAKPIYIPTNSVQAFPFIFPPSFLSFFLPSSLSLSLSFFLSFFFFLFLFRVVPTAYGYSKARGENGVTAASLHHSHSKTGIWAMSVTYTTVHSNSWSPTHWVRPGIEPASSWILVRFISTVPQWKLQELLLFTSIPAFICRLFVSSHSDKCEVISHCSFDLHLSDD